ncbi:hypothetical protein LIER_19332 [Lithospermum erythrorhizon]|uniref:Uncharacterized protein n=1 Tax=Lithospermum erythrorhizon TaxID=34254 RepID=A0AAV3QIG5_LITER
MANNATPANQPLYNEAVSRQLAEIARMLAQLTSQVAEIPRLHLLLKEQSLHLPPRLREDRPPNSKFFPGSFNLVNYDNSRDYKQTRDYGRAARSALSRPLL